MNRLDPAMPLKPQPVCLKMILCEKNTNLHQREFKNPFLNFKIEFGNDCSKKRPLQDSTSDDGYETPAKKTCSPKDLSLDLGCFMDDSSRDAATGDSVSPSAISLPALLDKVQTIRSEINEGAGPPLHDVKCGPSTELGVHKPSVPHGLRCDDVLVNLLPAFDCDAEDILCLDPSDNIESKSPSNNTFLQNLSLIMSGSVLESHTTHVEALEGNTEEAWDIGSPIFESSIFQASVVGEEDILESSYETTLPLQVKVSCAPGGTDVVLHTCSHVVFLYCVHLVQYVVCIPYIHTHTTCVLFFKVKSVVVDPSQRASSSETAAAAPPLLKPSTDENRGSRTVKLVSSAVRYCSSLCHV